MKIFFLNFKHMMLCVRKDGMLVMACFAPLLCGCFFKFLLPIFITTFHLPNFESLPSICDLLLLVITPIMFCFISAMIILEEIDDHICGYLAITPLTKRGYLYSRLGLPTLLAIFFTLPIFMIFQLSNHSIFFVFLFSCLASLQGLIISLIIISFSSNKLEGMACAKLSSLSGIGMIIPFLLSDTQQYYFAFLPTFWLSKSFMNFDFFSIMLTLVTSMLWILLLSHKFIRKITK